MINYFESEPMKYFAPPNTLSKEARQSKLEQMASSGDYLFGLKTDGNWSRAIITPERCALQTRGISKVTGTYGEIQNKVLFWDAVRSAFKDITVILGEVYLPGGIDKDCGAILRCLDDKAIARQKKVPLRWRIFDVLALNGVDLMNTPFEERIKNIPIIVSHINSPLVSGVDYREMDETFFDQMADIFAAGGEGSVCYRKDSVYIPGKRGPHAWDTCKVKQEITSEIDCVITGVDYGEKIYTGKDMAEWMLWQNQRTGELLYGAYFGEYQVGGAYLPVTKNFYNGWPAAIKVGVYNKDNQLIPLCKVSGLTEEIKSDLRDHLSDWIGVPVSISGMMVSEARMNEDGEGISIRHPLLKRIRKDDLNPKDCTLAKIYD